jgi:glycosyltransferase involved in cell wall biosynthesis
MKHNLSITIICKNEVESIGHALESVMSLSDDIVVYDSGSTDGTLELLRHFPVRVFTGDWNGFGKNRQKAVELTRHPWILVLDADERLSKELVNEIQGLELSDDNKAYRVRLCNHMGDQYIRFGDWGNDFRLRLYHKEKVRWNDSIVHEKLVLPAGIQVIDLKGTVRHQTVTGVDELSSKLVNYAQLTALQYHRQGRKSTWVKRHIGPVFTFLKNYFFLLGFLDGRNGYVIAKVLAFYTFVKYTRLLEISEQDEFSKYGD